jgi:hypothetical protein
MHMIVVVVNLEKCILVMTAVVEEAVVSSRLGNV